MNNRIDEQNVLFDLNFNIEGMTCTSGESYAEKVLARVKGLIQVIVNSANEKAAAAHGCAEKHRKPNINAQPQC